MLVDLARVDEEQDFGFLEFLWVVRWVHTGKCENMEVIWNVEEGRMRDGTDLDNAVECEIKDVASWSG